MKRIFQLLICISLTVVSYGQTKSDKSKVQMDGVCNTFMQLFNDGKSSEAFELLRQNTVISIEDIDNLEKETAGQMETISPKYGKMVSSDFIIEQKIKDYLATRFYILKFEKCYLKFNFTLYKSSTGWTITGFTFDQEILDIPSK